MLDTPANNIPYLFAAFAVTWAVFFAYVFFTFRRQEELRREVDGLKQRLEDDDGPPGAGG